jgi:FSR family fosmidomycin resistance protein-like MFS transporter
VSQELAYPVASAPSRAVVEPAPPASERGLAIWVLSISHGLNHVQGNIANLLYPLMMADLHFGYFQIGLLSTAYVVTTNGLQALCGLLTPYVRRSVILGVGNCLLALATAAAGLVQSYSQLLVTRLLGGVGSSPQHPIGSSLLATLYPQARGRVLALHTTGGNVGTLAAPLIVSALVFFFDWRTIFLIVAVPSLLMGLAYFLLRDRVPQTPRQRGAAHAATWRSYLACLRNRNLLLVSAIQMVGAAGRGQGNDIAFLMPHFVNDFHLDQAVAALLITVMQVGGLFGPLALGWISDRWSRKKVLMLSLALAALTTWALAAIGAPGPLLLLNLLAYGVVVNSRLTLTQALVADAMGVEHADAAFSLYYFIGFISAPLWTLLIGWVMEAHGFAAGFTLMAASYLAGMTLIGLVQETRPPAPQAA